jgi:hypothetical protein
MGVQDKYGINTVSLFGNYHRYADKMANKPGPFQSYYQDVVNKQNKEIDRANTANVQSNMIQGGQSYDSQAQGTMYSDAASLGLE